MSFQKLSIFLAGVSLLQGCIPFDTDIPLDYCTAGIAISPRLDMGNSCVETVDDYRLDSTEFDSYIAIDGDEIVLAIGDLYTPSNIASVRKSVVSVLFGIANEKGLVDLDATLAEIGVGDSKSPLTEQEKQATIRDLLQARSGIFIKPLGEASSWAKLRPDRGEYAPGEFWFYNNWDFNALGTVFSKVVGMSLEEAIDEWLAKPLEFQTYCPEHITYEYSDTTEHPMYRVYMSAYDLAIFGGMVAQNGAWKGKQIVSASWITETTQPISDVRSIRPDSYYTHYGYLWWLDAEGDIWADGSGGQFIHIDPESDRVTVARNQTGISVAGRIWYSNAEEFGTPESEIALRAKAEECF